ncbi:dihydrodipicolinate reductase [Hyperthermus butylicus]|uniref:NAD(P)H-dependent amine dehydrogenase family protein n=1 Tax=Hyperthermus butylicus TaxID=54248 RepID=UPI001E41BE33|nr:dihydrodipicolinate reductase [Hyperthermus butylicus]
MLRLGFYGFGSIGMLTARLAIERGYEVVAAVDIAPELVGRDVGEVLRLGEKLGVRISRDPSVLSAADVVIHATGSYLDKVYPQIANVIRMGRDVVSTCETLAYPYYLYPTLARSLDRLARLYGVAVLGTGINPGFLLDTLAVVLAAPFHLVERIVARRSVDAAKRRKPFQRKIGVGEDPKVVEEKLKRGDITGHVGYAESVLLIADAAGLHLERIVEGQEVVPAERDVESAGVRVPRGMNLGIKGYGAGYAAGREVIRVEFHAYVGAEEYEEIIVEGRGYSVRWRSTGTPGDIGTASVLLNIAEVLPEYGPGLLTMADLVPFKPKFAVQVRR